VNSSKELEITEGEPRRRLTEVYLAVFSDQDGDENVIQVRTPGDVLLPLVAIDRKALGILQKFAQDTADQTGQSVSIICFTDRTVYESFRPTATGD